jgi:hypothetical protein
VTGMAAVGHMLERFFVRAAHFKFFGHNFFVQTR